MTARSRSATFTPMAEVTNIEKKVRKSRTVYDPELAELICERVAEGKTLTALTLPGGPDAIPGAPTRKGFNDWVLRRPELARAYRTAQELSSYALEEKALDMAYELAAGTVQKDLVRAYEVAMVQLRWSSGKRNPKVFSERAPVHFQVPIQINTSVNLGGEGAAPLGPDEAKSTYKVTAQVVEEGVPERAVEGEATRPPKYGGHKKRRGGR